MKANSDKGLRKKWSNSKLNKETDSFSLNNLFGAWEDSRDSDEIIKEIEESRVEKNDLEAF